MSSILPGDAIARNSKTISSFWSESSCLVQPARSDSDGYASRSSMAGMLGLGSSQHFASLRVLFWHFGGADAEKLPYLLLL